MYRQLFIIRIALLTGVVSFAALSAYQRARVPVSPEAAAMLPLQTMRYALWALAVVAVLVALFLRSRLPGVPAPARASMLIIGWAFGEGVALFGAVQHYIGGPIATMALGLLTFVVVLVLLPVPRAPAKAG